MIGKQIGKYKLLEKRGEGGFGVLYKAFDTVIEREIAFKLLHQQMAAEEKFSAWFHREAKAMAKLNHPNIVTIYNFEVVDNYHFIVMEYIDGKNVDEILREKGPFSQPELVSIGRQLLSSLGYAHNNGIIHRDIKPSNIMVTESGLVKITDFGIAKILGSSKLTQTGTAAGSLPYMSPEQIRGKREIDSRTDIYSLGITLYQMVTGEVPFKEDSDFLLMQAHLEKPPPKPSLKRPDIPEGLEKVLLKALEKDVDQRYKTTQDMSRDLVKFQTDANIPADDEGTLASMVFENKSDDRTIIAPSSDDPTKLKPHTKKGPRPILYILGVVVLVVVVFVVIQQFSGKKETETGGTAEDTPKDTVSTVVEQPKDTATVAIQTPVEDQTGPDQNQNNITQPKYHGKLEIFYTPFDYGSSAEVYIDNDLIAHEDVPIQLDDLKPGRHTILLINKNRDWENNRFFDTVTVTEDMQSRDYNFNAPTGKVRISGSFIGGSPSMWGEIYIDNKKQDMGTPYAFDLAEGPHKLAVVKDGYETVGGYKLVNIEPDGDAEINFKLRKK